MTTIALMGISFIAGFLLGTKYGGNLYEKLMDKLRRLPNVG